MRLENKSMTSEASDITHLVEDSDSDQEEWEEGRDFQLERKKNKLIRRLIKLVGPDDDRTPFNVAIIGPAGVGKSSFVNTVAAALSGSRWREYAYAGSHGGEGSQITVFTNSYPKCCNADNAKYENVHLPKFIDIAGFNDEDGDKWVELLRIVFYGRLPEGESLAQAAKCHSDHGMNGLIAAYSSNNDALKVDRIIFVSSATSPVPTKLITAVITAARPSGSANNPMKRTIPIFGVMTKVDKVGSESISQSEFDKREQQFIHALGLAGSKHRYLLCRNYCDDVDPEQKRTVTLLPDIDIPALHFMMQVCDPVITVGNEAETYSQIRPDSDTPQRRDAQPENVTPPASAPAVPAGRGKTKLRAALNDMGFSDTSITVILIAMEAMFLAFLFSNILRPTLDIGKLKSACNFMKEKGRLTAFDGVCSDLEASNFGSTFVISLAVAALVVLRIGVTIIFSKLYKQN